MPETSNYLDQFYTIIREIFTYLGNKMGKVIKSTSGVSCIHIVHHMKITKIGRANKAIIAADKRKEDLQPMWPARLNCN